MLRRRFLSTAALSAAAVALAACGSEAAPGDGDQPKVLIAQPWVRTTDGATDTSMSAAFMDLTNPGDQDVTLVSASADFATMVELHRMTEVDGKKVMEKAEDGILIEAGSHRHLVSGGYHIMLMGLTRELPIGDEVELVLNFDNGQVETITAMVKEFTEEEDHYHTPMATP
ncbi:copper chaperone PCu(A)C [Propionibacteriaceae bacterium Y1923]